MEFDVRLQQTLYYSVRTTANSLEEARATVQAQLDGENDDDLDIWEVDSTLMEICDE
jgi:hypothetical protein